jgi:predicted GIY-YIG superfamily endonuclease
MPYYVYILLCKDGSYYTGYAKDVKRRVERHKKGQGARYTRIHQPEKIVYVKKFDSRSEALKREREIKSLSHSKKQQLANSNEKSHALSRHMQ